MWYDFFNVCDALEGMTVDEMLAKKYDCELEVIDEEPVPVFGWEEPEDVEFVSSAVFRLNDKRRVAGKRKAEFKSRKRRKNAAKYERSGLMVAESGAVHARVGTTYNKKKYRRLTKAELDQIVEEAMEPIYSYRDYADDCYDDYLAYLDGEYDNWDDLWDYLAEDYDDYHRQVSDIQIRLESSYQEGFDAGKEAGYASGRKEGYDEGYDAGYAAALKEFQASLALMAAKA